ncbi:MAG: CoA pyrophosphatase [Magnetococcales bacterium]|nr:CoA pyrophosphatase [Magnetococcales bacterium]
MFPARAAQPRRNPVTSLEENLPRRVMRALQAVGPPHRTDGGGGAGGAVELSGRPGQAGKGLRAAAVLIPFIPFADGWRLLMIRRSETVTAHRGQIAFPGGGVEPGEDPWQAALREAWEELAIPPEAVERWGDLPPLETVSSGFLIHPRVGSISPEILPRLRPDPDEVAATLTLPWRFIAAPPREGDERLEMETLIHDGHSYVRPCYYHGGMKIWGASATVLHQLVTLTGAAGDDP